MSTQVRFADILRWLETDDWKFEVREENVIRMGCRGDNGRFEVIVRFRPEKDLISVSFYYPFTVPEEKRVAVAELVTRLNYWLLLGGFQMDFRDGEVQYFSSMPVDSAPLVTEQFKTLIYVSWNTIDKYQPAFTGVTFGSQTPEEALAAFERK